MLTPLDLAKQIYEEKRQAYVAPDLIIPPPPEPKPTPAERLEVVTREHMDGQIPNVKPIGALVKPEPNSADEIIGRRFLCRRGGLLFPSPTGIGKSTFTIQTFSQAALGHSPYGLPFTRPTKTLYVQAENDEGDMAEMRDGIYDAMEYSADDRKAIDERFFVMSEATRTGLQLIEYVEGAIKEYQPDVLILDPLFAYLGGSANDQSVVSAFLRNMVNPLLHDYNIAAWLVHHTNKPPSGEQKPNWQGGELAYLGAGSAEFANWARCVLTIRQTKHKRIFELCAPKRGMRLGWVDGNDERTNMRYIAHAEGSICWQDCDWDYAVNEIQEAGESSGPGRKKTAFLRDAVTAHSGYPFVTKMGAVNAIMGVHRCNEKTARALRDENMECVDGKWVAKC